MAAISFVFTIACVAEMLAQDEEWLGEISIGMDPEDGRLRVIGIGGDEYTAFTQYGVECLKQIIIDERSLLARKAASDA